MLVEKYGSKHQAWLLKQDAERLQPNKILKAERENTHWKYHEALKPQKRPPPVTYFLQ